MRKRIGAALLFATILFIIIALFSSFGLAQDQEGSSYAVELTDWWTNDQGADPPGWEKDVAECSGSLVDTDADGLNDHFAFAIENGYPGYQCTLNLNVHNAGSETVTATGIGISSDKPGEVTTSVSQPTIPWTLAPDDGAPGGEDEVVVVFAVHVEQSATPNTTYSITGAIELEG